MLLFRIQGIRERRINPHSFYQRGVYQRGGSYRGRLRMINRDERPLELRTRASGVRKPIRRRDWLTNRRPYRERESTSVAPNSGSSRTSGLHSALSSSTSSAPTTAPSQSSCMYPFYCFLYLSITSTKIFVTTGGP